MRKYLSLGLTSLVAAVSFSRKYRDQIAPMERDLDRRIETELELRREKTVLDSKVVGLIDQLRKSKINDLKSQVESTSTCPCPSCKLMRKFPAYGYVNRISRAIARGDHE